MFENRKCIGSILCIEFLIFVAVVFLISIILDGYHFVHLLHEIIIVFDNCKKDWYAIYGHIGTCICVHINDT